MISVLPSLIETVSIVSHSGHRSDLFILGPATVSSTNLGDLNVVHLSLPAHDAFAVKAEKNVSAID
jgi:hypothetical protein